MSRSEMIKQFDVPAVEGYQGGIVKNGKYYQTYGFGELIALQQIDLDAGKVDTYLDLTNAYNNLSDEPEAAFIWRGHLCFYTLYLKVFRCWFD